MMKEKETPKFSALKPL